MNTPTMPRMTVTGERIISPITDPINRNTDAAKKARAALEQLDGFDISDFASTAAYSHNTVIADQLRAALDAQEKPHNTLSVLCKRDLHRECDDYEFCACGCHSKR